MQFLLLSLPVSGKGWREATVGTFARREGLGTCAMRDIASVLGGRANGSFPDCRTYNDPNGSGSEQAFEGFGIGHSSFLGVGPKTCCEKTPKCLVGSNLVVCLRNFFVRLREDVSVCECC